MSNLFTPIRPRRIAEEIVEQIKELIAKGELKPGQNIPSERDLATLLGVSRPSVREAITVLEAMGYLESRQGGGTYVRSLTQTSLADPLSDLVGEKSPRILHALVEVRMGLESWSASLAAQRARPEEIERMRELLEKMEAQVEGGGWDAEIDSQFHYAITTATHNTLQVHVLQTIHSLFHATVQVALMEFYRKGGYIDILRQQHREIFEAIADPRPGTGAAGDDGAPLHGRRENGRVARRFPDSLLPLKRLKAIRSGWPFSRSGSFYFGARADYSGTASPSISIRCTHLLRQAGPLQTPGQLQVATGIGGDQQLGAGCLDILKFAVENLLALVGVLETEGRGRTAAPAGLLDFPVVDPGYGLDQVPRLFADTLGMAEMAGLMVGDNFVDRL